MNKKTITLLTILLLCTGIIRAQVGIQLGFSQSIERTKIGSNEKFDRNAALNGFKVGVLYEHSFKHGLGLYYALNYTFLTHQGNWSQPSNGWQYRTNETEHFMDVPLHFQYKLLIAKETYVMAYAGATFIIGLDGTVTTQKKNSLPENNPYFRQETMEENRYKIDTDGDFIYDYSRFDIQASVGLGLQFHNFQLKGGYDFGLLNQNDKYYNKTNKPWFNYRNEWNIRFVYLFGK